MSEPHDLIVPVLGARVPVDVRLDFPLPPDETPLREQLSGDLYLTYALDHPPSEDGSARFQPVTPRLVRELGLDPAQLRARAVANLRVRRPDRALNWFPGVQAVTATVGGDLEAGLLLDEALLEELAQKVDGDLVVGIPARDVFTATGSRDEQGLAKLRWVADRVWARGDHLLSRHLLIRRDGRWTPLA